MLFPRAAFILTFLHFIHILSAHDTKEHDSKFARVIKRDVCVIGGGSSGTYAAIRLLQSGASVALVERQPVLGGHVNTFHDPVTDETFDYGVISFDNISAVTNYFASLDVPLVGGAFGGNSVTKFANFKTATPLPSFNSTPGNLAGALLAYGGILNQFSFLPNGFDLPSPVPQEFLVPWGDFLSKHGLNAMAYTAFQFLEGAGNILNQPVLYVLKYFDANLVRNLVGASNFVTTARHNNHELYDKALAKLGNGSSAFVSSNVVHISRTDAGVSVVVSTSSGRKVIEAKKLVIALPPLLSNLRQLGMDLSKHEAQLFREFNSSFYWDCVLRNSGIPDDVSISNADPAAPFGIPALPGIYGIGSTGLPGLHTAYFSSPHFLPDDFVRKEILTTNAKLVRAYGFTPRNDTEIVGFNNHSPFEVTVSTRAIREGFYDKVNALQGTRSTWWTGAAWQAQDSSQLWNWTEHNLLPRILSSLGHK